MRLFPPTSPSPPTPPPHPFPPRFTGLTTPPSIISVTTYSAILSSPDAQRDKLTGAKKPVLARVVGGGGWGWTFVKLCLFVGVGVGALYGYKTYQLRQARGGGLGGGSFGGMGRMQGFGGGAFDSKRF